MAMMMTTKKMVIIMTINKIDVAYMDVKLAQ